MGTIDSAGGGCGRVDLRLPCLWANAAGPSATKPCGGPQGPTGILSASMQSWLEDLLQEHGSALRAGARRWYPRDPHAQEDLYQETAAKLWATGPGWVRGDTADRSYMLTAMRNLAIDQHRRRSRRQESLDSEQEASCSSFEEQLVDRVVLRACLEKLTPDERAAIRLVQEYGGVGAAEKLGLKKETVWSRHRRAIGKLRRMLLEGGQGESEMSET